MQHEYSDKSALKVTIAKWNSPKGNNIHGTGIKPDVEVKLPAIF
ncbi:S41 family peptidase, partial [Erysipelothrix rhusiopathiae]|nr:S41 family peptidase [Erysipelothrix rhusiopathiae]